MASKRGGSTPATNWDKALSAAVLEDDGWSISMVMVTPGRVSDHPLLEALLEAVRTPLRLFFSAITMADIKQQIDDHMKAKAKRSKDLPEFSEVLESGKAAWDAGQSFPPALMAKLIKFMLLRIKNTFKVTPEKGIKAGKASTSSKGPGKASAQGKVKTTPQPELPKKQTKLKKRGEENKDVAMIEDAPSYGPKHYVLLLGFHQAELLPMLGILGVSISAVVCLSARSRALISTAEAPVPPCEGPNIAELESFWHTLGPMLEIPKWWAYLHDVVRLECSIEDELFPPLDVEHEMEAPRGAFIFNKVAHLVYQCLEWQIHYRHYISSTRFLTLSSIWGSSGGSAMTSLGIKKSTTHLSYSLTTKKKRASVARNQDVAVASSDFQRPPEVDLRYYEALMKCIPLECCSTSLILYCLLEQVVASKEGWSLPNSPESPGASDGLHPEIAKTLAFMMHTLAIESTEKELLADFAHPEAIQSNTPIAPKLLSYGDEISHRTHHLEPTRDLDVSQVELQMLKLLLRSKIMRTTTGSTDKLQRAHAQHLLQHCSVDNRSDMVVHHAIMQFVFESLELPHIGTSEHGRAILWDRPLAFVEKPVSTSITRKLLDGTEEPNVALQGEANESSEGMETIQTLIKSTQLRCLDDWTHCEHYRPSVLIQVLLNAKESYHSMQRYSLASEDAVLFCFYNPLTQPLQLQETWHCSLHTNIYFRDYLEHVADSISEWIQWEFINGPMDITNDGRIKLSDKKYPGMTPEIDNLKNTSICEKRAQADNFEHLACNTSIRTKSLKGQVKETEQEKEAENKKGWKSESKRAPSSTKKKEPLADCLVKDQDVALTTKVNMDPPAKANITPLKHVFLGYEMDHKLVHLSGTDTTLFPVDGGEIHVKTTHFAKEDTAVQTCIRVDGHCFTIHTRIIGSTEELPDIAEPLVEEMQPSVRPELFSMILADGIVLSFSQSRGHCETEGSTFSINPLSTQNSSPSHTSLKNESNVSEAENTCFLTLSLCCPNGLTLHFQTYVPSGGENEKPEILVRQVGGPQEQLESQVSNCIFSYGPSPQAKETSRLVTGQGAVIRSFSNKSMQVLFADGTTTYCPPVEEQTINGFSDMGLQLLHGKESNTTEAVPLTDNQRSTWITTTSTGRVIAIRGQKILSLRPLEVIRTAEPGGVCENSSSGQQETVVMKREDGTVIVLGESCVVDHGDGTRITTCAKDVHSMAATSDPLPKISKQVMVEKVGFATLLFDCEDRVCTALTGSGTLLRARPEGSFQVFPANSSGNLTVHADGTATYVHSRRQTAQAGGHTGHLHGIYTLCPKAHVTCEAIDSDGNIFRVQSDGKTAVIKAGGDGLQDEEFEDRESLTSLKTKRPESYGEHAPRFFLIHPDWSGTELLRMQDVEQFLSESTCDPSTVLLQESLPDNAAVQSVTVLTPEERNWSTSWLSPPFSEGFTSVGLRTQSERCILSQKATKLGLGLSSGRGHRLASGIFAFDASRPALPPSCPPVLHIRQLLSFPRISPQQRHDLQLRLKGYLEELRQKEKWTQEVRPLDLQNGGKQISTTGGHRVYLYTSNSKSQDQDLEETEISQRYLLAIQKVPPTPAVQVNIADAVEEISETEREKREKKRLLWSDKIEWCRKKEQEARECLHDLVRKAIPPYFSSQREKVVYVNQIPELEALTQALPPLNKKEACILTTTPQNHDNREASPHESIMHHSLSADHIKDLKPQEVPQTTKPNILLTKAGPWDSSALRESSTQTKRKSLFFDLLGNSRKNRVPLPLSMEVPHPRHIPNPRVLNYSLDTNPFLFVPAHVAFGEVRRGERCSRNVMLHNLSLQKHRYKVKQPANETGLQVLYRPGIISAGIRTVLCVELQAMTHGKVAYDIEIQMDTHTLFLPVSATVIPYKAAP